MVESGIPIGDWSSELKTANGMNISYQRKISNNLCAEAGIEATSYRTIADLYHVNIFRLPIGLTYIFFERDKWGTSFTGKIGLSAIERVYDEASEIGFNESYSLSMNVSYNLTEKNQISIYTKYNQERIINGKSYVGIGIAFGFDVF
ncbi:MAG: hypothetical protein COX48_05360 [bacterium (Candidatus Stahlbacteria) CG23_combo_of_CG06-09_8_20_14_all_34_7]|nr:MAG: hypothetical protein COX48_05360 [bacterium (Candidatus Stahlbacteria) CG23_combo_of_CG06-09_8_20_14_all_34_7]